MDIHLTIFITPFSNELKEVKNAWVSLPEFLLSEIIGDVYGYNAEDRCFCGN